MPCAWHYFQDGLADEEATPDAILELAASVYDGLSPEDINEVEQIALDRHDFFGDQR